MTGTKVTGEWRTEQEHEYAFVVQVSDCVERQVLTAIVIAFGSLVGDTRS